MTVTVTWMDGRQETYRCHDARTGIEGVLHLHQQMHSGEPYRGIPPANVRIWTRTDP